MDKFPIYKMVIDDSSDTGLNAVALVDTPAIERLWMKFNAEIFIDPKSGESQSEFLTELDIYGYKPKHFDMCPGAVETFTHLISMNVGVDEQGMVRSAAQIADTIFRIEKEVINNNAATIEQVDEVVILVDDFKDLMNEIDKLVDMQHNVSYMDGHVLKVKSYLSTELKFESYNDYPKQASENAKIALRWAEENGWGDCGTPVGKARANQLANGEAISRDTIARMAAFERHRQNSQKELGDGCGRLMWLAWGGDAGVEWAQRKLENIDLQSKMQFAIQNEDRRIVTGPLLIANLPIYRKAEDGSEFYVVFDAPTIEQLVMKYHKDGFQHSVNLMHNGQQVEGVFMFESFIIDSKRGISAPSGFNNVPDGSYFVSYKIENDEVWNLIKTNTFKGFSAEGFFLKKLITATEEEVINRLREILS